MNEKYNQAQQNNSTMATQPNDDKVSYEKEKERFVKEILQFHEARGTPARRVPKINGYEIDLYLLYTLVTSRGGWVKVNSRNEWDQVLDEFNIPKRCVNSDVAIKQIYLRYLDKYEKVHFHGDLGNDEDESSRHRQFNPRTFHSIPMTYNHAQHTFADSLRSNNGLSLDLYVPSEYDKLALSLISPLPNEQDFAINVCTLLSNEGKHCLKLKKHPRILHYLLAHAAVFHDPSLRTLFHEIYGKYRGHSMSHLWRDIVTDESILKLTDESQYVEWDEGTEDGSDAVSNKAALTLEPDDKELFCLGRTLGVQDYIGQRVCQIAAILRNLTFVNENMLLMGKDLTFLRFIVLCCYSNWDSLHQMGWDMLCNVATEITERAPIMDHVLGLTFQGLLSEDRADILSALEVLTKLAQNEVNEELVVKNLKRDIYERICSFLTLHDIMLLVCTLECLNALTALGEKACNSVLGVHGVIDVLVSLVSVEAQSYGPKACIQMRVVETVRDYNAVCAPSQTPTPASTAPPPTTSQPPPLTTTSPSVSVAVAVSHQTPPRPQPSLASQLSSTPRIVTASPSTATFTAQATEQIAQENEKFALAWLRCTYEPSANGKVEQAELYKQYINYCAKIGRRGVIAPLHFPRIVRTVFGGSVGPKVIQTLESTQHLYEGIQMRVKPLVSTPIPSTSVVHTNPSSILKAQLSAPPKPTPTTPVKMQIVTTSAEVQSSQGATTSFMKTLLANKIVEHQKQQQLQQQQLLQQQQQQQQQIIIQQEHSNDKSSDNQPSASISFDESSQSSTQEGITFKLNGIRSLMEILGKQETVVASGNIRQQPNLFTTQINNITPASIVSDDVSTSNSSSIKGDASEMGTEENSKSSIDGFLNSIGQSCIVENTAMKESKIEIKTETAPLNGPEIGELDNIKIEKDPSRFVSNGIQIKEEKKEPVKRPHEKEEDVNIKKTHFNGDETEEATETVNVSSSAANLYAALAADVLEDEPMEETPPPPPGPVQVATSQPTQILVTAGGQVVGAQVVGGQYVVPQGKSLGQDQKQTVLVAQTPQQQGTTAKTIIILQPQGPSGANPQQLIRFQFPSPQTVIPASQTTNIIRTIVPPKVSSATTNVQEVISNATKVITSTAVAQQAVTLPTVPAPCATFVSVSSSTSNNLLSTNTASNSGKVDAKPVVEQRHFLCEWRGCMRNFNSENEVYLHACDAHLPNGSEEIQCLWERCDAMKRKRFSLMTHLYDKHCNPDEMKMVAARRKQLSVMGKTELPTPTPQALPHPGYGPNAAYHAIKRHALDIVNVKDSQQRIAKPGPTPVPVQTEQSSNEGPVTKSIRLTASLILRNIVVYSTNGRRHLMRYESFLACVALSNVESSRTIAHVLFDLCHSR